MATESFGGGRIDISARTAEFDRRVKQSGEQIRKTNARIDDMRRKTARTTAAMLSLIHI